MKRTLFLASFIFFVLAGVVGKAQSWSTSKPVNEVASKDLFDSEELAAVHIVANTTSQPADVSMKGVSRVSVGSSKKSSGNIPSRGTPSWVNGKGVSALSVRETRGKLWPAEGTEQLIPSEEKETNK